MKIFLPPSEGKKRPSSGAPLVLERLAFPELNGVRERLVTELQEVSGRPDALEILGVGASLESEIRSQIDLLNAPAAPAREVYAGVLFEAARFAELPQDLSPCVLEAVEQSVLVFSALFGVTTLGDSIPSYRLAMGVNLPQMGNSKTLWKHELRGLPVAGAELVVDCRSGAYQVWDPPADAAWVRVNSVRENSDGLRKTVSHHAKHIRGLLAGQLVRMPVADAPITPADLAEFADFLVKNGDARGIELTEEKANRYELNIVI